MTKDIMIGVDLAKNVFQLHAVSMTGQPKFCKKLSRSGFAKFMGQHTPSVVVMGLAGVHIIGPARWSGLVMKLS